MYDKLIKELREYWNDGTEDIRNEAADAIEDLWQALDTAQGVLAEQPSTWIPVTEQLPDENDVVLITDSLDVGTGYLIHGYGWISPFDDIDTSHVTHWMPLPEQPKEKNENNT